MNNEKETMNKVEKLYNEYFLGDSFKMNKSKLKDGYILENRQGTRFLKSGNMLRGEKHFDYLTNYNHDLTNESVSSLDIVKVYNEKSLCLSDIFKDKSLMLLWERKKESHKDRIIRLIDSYIYDEITYIELDLRNHNNFCINTEEAEVEFKKDEVVIKCSEITYNVEYDEIRNVLV